MYHPDKYSNHNQALATFCEQFNLTAVQHGGVIEMKPSSVENYREDGQITYIPTGKTILYDFEKRNKYYPSYGFTFSDFGQFERKIQKPEILLSIQCSTDEQAFCIAWHHDFRNEPVKHIGSSTASGDKEFTGKRFTTAFKEFRYAEMELYYQVLRRAFASNQFNALSFQ